jgi:hypothetical protein
MIKIFVPVKKPEGKAKIRGLWINEAGRLCYDYLRIKSFNSYLYGKNCNNLYAIDKLEALKILYKQKAIFFISKNNGYIFYDKYKIKLLPKVLRLSIGKNKKNLKGLIKRMLKDYKGLTIFKEALGYTLEAYYD